MKLGELGSFSSDLLNRKVRQKFGFGFNTKHLTLEKANILLAKVDENIRSYKKANGNLLTERSSHFSNLILVRDSLKSYLKENDKSDEQSKCKVCHKMFTPEYGEHARCPDCKADQHSAAEKATGVESKQFENKPVIENRERKIMITKVDHQKLQRAVEMSEAGKAIPARYLDTLKEALAKLTVKKEFNEQEMRKFFAARGKALTEGEVEQAQAILASKDLVDRLQGMLEDVGGMVNEDIPPLTDTIRNEIGSNEASKFNSEVTASLNSLLDTLRQTREQIDAATRELAGEQSDDMGMPTDGMDPTASGLDSEIDSVVGDDFTGSDAAVGGANPLGREKR